MLYALSNNYNENFNMIFHQIHQIVFQNILLSFEEGCDNFMFQDKVIFPLREALELAIKLYKDMILPYENYIKNNLSDILSIHETILRIYVQYVTYPFTNNIIFMTDCQEDEYKENSKIRELIPLYHELKELRENSNKIVRLIYLGLEKKENFIEEDYLLKNFSAQLFSQFISFHFDDMCYSMIYARLNICYLLIKKHFNFISDKINYEKLKLYQYFSAKINFLKKAMHKEEDYFLILNLLIKNKLKDMPSRRVPYFVELTPSFSQVLNIQSNLKKILEFSYEQIEKLSTTINENNKIKIDERIPFFNLLFHLMINEQNCYLLYVLKTFGKLTALLINKNYYKIDLLDNIIRELGQQIKETYLPLQNSNYMVNEIWSQKLFDFSQIFFGIISDFDKYLFPEKYSLIVLYLVNNLQVLSYNYYFFSDKKYIIHQKFMFQIENYIYTKCLDQSAPSDTRLAFFFVLYSLLDKKVTSHLKTLTSFSMNELLQKNKNNIKNRTLSELKKSKKVQYFVPEYAIDLKFNIAINPLLSFLLHIHSLYQLPTTLKEYSSKMLTKKYDIVNFSQRKLTKMIYYLIRLGYLKSESINLNELLNQDQDWQHYTSTFEIITALCYYEIIDNDNYHVVNTLVDQLSNLINTIKSSYIDELMN